jgi:hypothetical protein
MWSYIVEFRRLATMTAFVTTATVVLTTASAANATSATFHPFLGGGVVFAPTRGFHAAQMTFTAPTVDCAKGATSVLRVGIFGVDHYTNTRTAESWERRWFAGVVARCAGRRRAQDRMILRGSAWAIPAGDRIQVDDSYDGHCESPSVGDETKGEGLVTACSVGGPPKLVRDRPGWRHLFGARLSADSPASPVVLLVAASANHRPLGTTRHYIRVQHLHHSVAAYVPTFERDQKRIRVVVR